MVEVLEHPIDGEHQIPLTYPAKYVVGCTPSHPAVCSARIEKDKLIVTVLRVPGHPPPARVTVVLFVERMNSSGSADNAET